MKTIVVRCIGACLLLGLAGAQSSTTNPSEGSPENSTTQPGEPRFATTRISIEMLRRIQAHLGKVRTVEADFVQEKNLAMLSHTLVIRGHFALQKPDRLIWITRQPVRYAIRIEGEEVQQWDEDTNRVEIAHLGGDPTFKAVSEQIQAWFLGNYEALAKSYDVDVLSENPLELGFTPSGDSMVAKMLKHVEITFSKDEQYIGRIAVDEVDGDTTTLQFINPRVNEPVSDEVWRMPPNER
jgi:outer membrane lipoprotein-sorting protein